MLSLWEVFLSVIPPVRRKFQINGIKPQNCVLVPLNQNFSVPPLPLPLSDLQHQSNAFGGSFKPAKCGLFLSELGSEVLRMLKVKLQMGNRQSGLSLQRFVGRHILCQQQQCSTQMHNIRILSYFLAVVEINQRWRQECCVTHTQLYTPCKFHSPLFFSSLLKFYLLPYPPDVKNLTRCFPFEIT